MGVCMHLHQHTMIMRVRATRRYILSMHAHMHIAHDPTHMRVSIRGVGHKVLAEGQKENGNFLDHH